MSFTYVVPDIHGRADLLRDGLAAIATHAAGHAGTIVGLGDYVNKGPDSKGAVDVLRHEFLPGWRRVLLKGNHDAMMVAGLRDPSRMSWWLERGGDATIRSYSGHPSDVPAADVEWLDQLALMHVDRFRVYVHAGLDPELPLERQTEKTLLWKRYAADDAAGFGERHIVHGHDSFPDGPKLLQGRTNLDAQAWRTGRLVIGLFDDDKSGGPVDFITVQGARENPS
jgi:serine/threonine protein phosphatase 1